MQFIDHSFAEEWLQSVGADDPNLFEHRLTWDDLTLEEAERIFRSPIISHGDCEFSKVQNWLRESSSIEDGAAVPNSDIPFYELWDRIAIGALCELTNVLPEEVSGTLGLREGRVPQGGVLKGLKEYLVKRLAEIGEGIVWNEFISRRPPDQAIYAHLGDLYLGAGSIRRSIYCHFVEELRSDGLSALVAAYPIFQFHLCTILNQWTKNCLDILIRAHTDLPELIKTFNLPHDAAIEDISFGLSDPHRGGQSVAIIHMTSFSCGTEHWKVVYKPKDLGLDKAFQDLLRKLPPPRTGDSSLRSAAILERCGYGYMEFIPHTFCSNNEQLAKFYRNAGRLTALLYVLGCTDCHHENLIACDEQIHIVDAETLLTGCFDYAENNLNARVANSVASVGLLPQWHYIGRHRIARDVTALGIEPPQQASQRAIGWLYINTDAMMLGETERPSIVPTSSPVGIGQANRLNDFVVDFCGGFSDELMAIQARRSDWLEENGHLTPYADKARRVVVRPTWIYMWLRRQQLKPDNLRSPYKQRLVLEMLSRSYLRSSSVPRDWPLFHAELTQMQNLDVPFFEMKVADTTLAVANGRSIDNFVGISGYDNARRKIEVLDDKAVQFEIELLRGTIAAKSRPALPEAQSKNSNNSSSSLLDYLTEAELIGDHLIKAAINDGDDGLEWLGIDVLEDLDKFRFGPLGLSLYGGRTGVALFLAALSRQRLSRSDHYRRFALRAVSDLPEKLFDAGIEEQRRWWRDQPLGLAGTGGVILGLLHLMVLLPELDLGDGLNAVVSACQEDFLQEDDRLDIVFGVAGLIGPLLMVGSDRALHLAQTAGEVLLDRQGELGGWQTGRSRNPPLTGFSHGASGPAAALAVLDEAIGGFKFGDCARRAVAYEASKFDRTRLNWPDFRAGNNQEPTFMLSWCHGAPGIALSRLCIASARSLKAANFEELEHALTSTSDPVATPFVDSLCCGRLGRAAILRMAAAAGGREWLRAAQTLERRVLESKMEHGHYASINSPGLFCGLSGVGLALLEGVDDSLGLLPNILAAGLYRRLCSA